MRSGPLLVALVLAGCAHRAGTGQIVTDAPAWSTSAGRTEARLEMAGSMLDLGRPREALEIVAAARSECHDELALDLLQARAYLALGMPGEASALLEPWDQRHPRDAELYRMLGLTRFEQERLEEAEAAFRRAIQIEPDDHDVQNNLGFLLLVRGRPEEAVPLLRRALELQPDQLRARSNLGFALAAQGLDREAIEVFRAVQPEAAALTSMGIACERRGEPQTALTWYRRALAVEPAQAVAAEAVQRLAPPSAPEESP
ncbi:MAG: tetratricopeptide repeat protein [Pseudomonadota bacterium]